MERGEEIQKLKTRLDKLQPNEFVPSWDEEILWSRLSAKMQPAGKKQRIPLWYYPAAAAIFIIVLFLIPNDTKGPMIAHEQKNLAKPETMTIISTVIPKPEEHTDIQNPTDQNTIPPPQHNISVIKDTATIGLPPVLSTIREEEIIPTEEQQEEAPEIVYHINEVSSGIAEKHEYNKKQERISLLFRLNTKSSVADNKQAGAHLNSTFQFLHKTKK